MTTDYSAISQYNEEQLGKDRKSRMSQVAMYATATHFVYELLQNADDKDATEICFKLTRLGLVVEHNGTPFTEQNVSAITYFGKGNTDVTKIGHFGLGFKSVFAYTASPKIHSGIENFEINDLYLRKGHLAKPFLKAYQTVFIQFAIIITFYRGGCAAQ